MPKTLIIYPCFIMFISFSNKCVYRLVSDTWLPVHFKENDGICKLYGGMEKKNGESSSNVATLRLDNVSIFINPTSRRRWDFVRENIKLKRVTNGKRRRRGEDKETTQA